MTRLARPLVPVPTTLARIRSPRRKWPGRRCRAWPACIRPGSMLLLVAAVAGGCSRDAPIVGPDLEPTASIVASVSPAASVASDDSNPGDIDDTLTRLLPALGERAPGLRDALLHLQAHPKDERARTAVQRAIDAIAVTLTDEYRPDLDALRLDLGFAAMR